MNLIQDIPWYSVSFKKSDKFCKCVIIYFINLIWLSGIRLLLLGWPVTETFCLLSGAFISTFKQVWWENRKGLFSNNKTLLQYTSCYTVDNFSQCIPVYLHLIVPFWYALVVYRVSLVEPWFISRSGDGAVVRVLAFHQCVPGLIPRASVTCWLSLLLVHVLAFRVFLWVLWFSSLHENYQHF